jgi:hypothetical protein
MCTLPLLLPSDTRSGPTEIRGALRDATVAAGARRGGHGVRSAVASAARRSRSRLLAMRRVASRAADARRVQKAR